MTHILLHKIAYARSGDKGNSVNIGVIAYTEAGYELLATYLTDAVVKNYFAALSPKRVTRYELPNLLALNFVLEEALAGGGSLSLRLDNQGKSLGQAILQLPLELPANLLTETIR
jgi:hypothetical protein